MAFGFGSHPGGFGEGPSLLRGTDLDPGEVTPPSSAAIPGLESGPLTNPAELGRTENPENDDTDRTPSTVSEGQADTAVRGQAGEAGELLNQEGREGPTRGAGEAPRGTPVPHEEGPGTGGLAREYWRRGQARIRTLTDLFGQDAMILGHLLFKVPPLAIRVKKGNITYRWKPLRTQESIAVKSGNGECYIEVDLAFVGLSQIQHSLANLVGLWKSVPFCFIENVHIRKMMVPENPDASMAVCLETLVMDAVSGRPNTVYATLLMKWFNYRPFSKNFWFRREWRPNQGTMPQVSGQGPLFGPVEDVDSSTNSREAVPESLIYEPRDTVLVDLSAIQDQEVLANVAREHPPEVGLVESQQDQNPGDPTMEGTYPVVYPFNSEPFLDRVRAAGRPETILSWNDGLTMNWNSFVRMPVPRSWQYTLQQNPTVSVAADPPREHSSPVNRNAGQPPAVTGDRDIIIFIGDSIMVGFTGQTFTGNGTNPGDSGIPFFEWPGNSYFPETSGFTYYGMMRAGARSRSMKNWWNDRKERAELKAEGNDAPCSRVAGVVIHAGTNDGASGPNLENIRTIMTEVSGYGAIPILCSLPPSGDADHLTPPFRSHLRLLLSDSQAVTYWAALPDFHSRMQRLVSEIDNAMFIDYHPKMVDTQFRGNRAAPVAEQYMNKNSPQSGYYNIHWTNRAQPGEYKNGYSEGGNYIHGLLPWNSLRGISPVEEETIDIWTVCHVEDGDTIWAWGFDSNNQRTLRNVRLQYIDTPETYGEYTEDEFNEDGARALPNGQDSYRPESSKYGAIAKAALRGYLPEQDIVTIHFNGTGTYGRWLGEIFKGEQNINLEMVKQGYAFADIPNRPSTGEALGEQEVAFDYWEAEEIAAGRRSIDEGPPGSARGVHSATRVDLINPPEGFTDEDTNNLSGLMNPADFRRMYRPSSDGGFGGAPDSCSEEEEPSRGYIILDGERINTSFEVNHSLQFTIGEDGTGNRTRFQPLVGGVLHWTAAENPGNRVFTTLTTKNISVHFAMDPDGTVWQYADPARVYTLNAGRSLGEKTWAIEIANYGAASPSRIPDRARDRPGYTAVVNGRERRIADFYDIQYQNIFELCDLIHDTLNLPKVVYTSPHEFVSWASGLRDAEGILGHYHAATNKIDPGPRLLDRLAARPGWSSASLTQVQD